ncbi:MAG: FapA family protein [Lachnospiraceae bacterium]|nr:FapA family protein [Lachnospiraceae bacterium]
MANGYFQLFSNEQGTYLRVFKATDGGEQVSVNEAGEYLHSQGIPYDLPTLNQGISMAVSGASSDMPVPLFGGQMPTPVNETYKMTISQDKMTATVRFYPASAAGMNLPPGARAAQGELVRDLNYNKVTHGIKNDVITQIFQNPQYCTDFVIAEGVMPRHGSNGHIEYLFNTHLDSKPALNEDGSVDFFNLNNICHCNAGQVLAKLTPEDRGEPGTNIMGEVIRPHDVKAVALKKTNNTSISEDKLTLTANVDGHVTLVEDKIFVANVYTVENVNSVTGNIEFEGSVVVTGNVFSNYSVKAKGNIEVRGVVEGAVLESGGDIIIDRGMKGMGRGTLKAENNIICQFIENAKVEAGGYVSSDAILHSQIMAANEITVTSKKGFITGGRVCAGNLINVKTLGSQMGSDTVVEVGVDPTMKIRIQKLQKRIAELNKDIKATQLILNTMAQKIASGVRISPDQIKNVQTMTIENKGRSDELDGAIDELELLQKQNERSGNAQVIVTGEVYSGTLIAIGDVSMTVRSSMSYCRFIKQGGEVKMTAI